MKQSLYSCATPSILRYNGKSRVCVSTNQQREWFQSNSLSLVVEVHADGSVRQD